MVVEGKGNAISRLDFNKLGNLVLQVADSVVSKYLKEHIS
jgi:hypothetical protein